MKQIYPTIASIIAITVISIFALQQGFNGVLLSLSLSAVAGLGGYSVKAFTEGKKKKKEGG
ncbi:MAG: hypothetical protein CMI54_06390 [Parcubacteria group bacterium]|jgi:hypothetical protein|nr:hypothetical protein [Parcubacteria group bacterium]|tara:strand:+ start:3329 stop:3511 length:183 start_codon:yes stop_codon:yes gene_type:complete